MNRRKAALPVAGGLALVLSAAFSPFMKHSIDAGLGNSAKAALTSKGVNGVQAGSNWASLNLKGPGASKSAALAAVHTMTNGDAVNKVTYNCTSGPCPGGNGTSVAMKDIGANGTVSGSGSANAGAGAGGGATGSGNASGANGSGTGNASGSGNGGANGASGANGSGSGSGSGASGSGSGSVSNENKSVEAQIREALGSQGVTFAPNSANLTSHAQSVLMRVAQILDKAPSSKVGIAGYTDNQGSASHNLTLSQSRAQATLQYLAAHGVAANRMTAAGHGAANPVATNATAAGRAQNRRIDFTVQGG